MRAIKWTGLGALVWLVAGAGVALAQDAGAPKCEPPCRAGYLCHQGKCVSACNPPCAEGEKCTAEGECVAAQPAPAGPPAGGAAPPTAPDPASPQPGGQPQPAPGGAGAPGQPPADDPWAQGTGASDDPWAQAPPADADGGGDPGQGFRAAFFFALGAGGGLSADGGTGSADLDVSFGPGFLLEGNFEYFGLGGGVRTFFWRVDNPFISDDRIKGIDYFFSPRLRIPFGVGELYLAVPGGLSTDVIPNDEVALGWNVAVLAGTQFYPSNSVGLFLELGGIFRRIDDDGATLKLNQFLIQLGVAVL